MMWRLVLLAIALYSTLHASPVVDDRCMKSLAALAQKQYLFISDGLVAFLIIALTFSLLGNLFAYALATTAVQNDYILRKMLRDQCTDIKRAIDASRAKEPQHPELVVK